MATTKVGTLMPTSATSSVEASSHDPGRHAPSTPAANPITNAMRIAVAPTSIDTGSDAPMISLTVRSRYCSEGPRSKTGPSGASPLAAAASHRPPLTRERYDQ